MDAIFYNESGDKYYSGRSFTITRNSTGAAVINNVLFRFQILADDSVQISWGGTNLLGFTTTAVVPLNFADIPTQFIGGAGLTYVLPILANDGLGEVIGALSVDTAARTFDFRPSAAGIIGAWTISAINNSIYPSSVTMPRLFP